MQGSGSLTPRWAGVSEKVGILVAVVLGLAALSALLSVNTFPIVTNDSVVYIGHSQDLGAQGVVIHGFRQFGYPLALLIVRFGSQFVGTDALLSMAVLQRVLLVAAGVLAVVRWKWKALPFLVFLFTATTIGYTNFILNEGLGLPIAALLSFPVVYYFEIARRGQETDSRRAVTLAALVAVGAFILFTFRFTFAVFGLAPLMVVVASWRTPFRRMSLAIFAVFLFVVSMLTVAMAVENEREFGVLTPIADGGPTRWYYAWHHVFAQHPENQTNPDLAGFYAEHNFLTFPREIVATGLPYEDQSELYADGISKMYTVAGMAEDRARVESMVWSLVGGRLHDVVGVVDAATESNRFEVDALIFSNQFAQTEGIPAFIEQYNNSELPGAVITDPIGEQLPIRDSQTVARWLLYLGFAILIAGLFGGTSRRASILALGVMIATAIGMGAILADNYRFLIAPSAFALAMATEVGVDLLNRISSSLGPIRRAS